MKHWFTLAALALASAPTLLVAQAAPPARPPGDVHARIEELGKLLEGSKLEPAEQERARAVVAELKRMLAQHEREPAGTDASPERFRGKVTRKAADQPADPHRGFVEKMHGLFDHGAGAHDAARGDGGEQRAEVERVLHDPAARTKLQHLMREHPAEALDHFESVFRKLTRDEADGRDPVRRTRPAAPPAAQPPDHGTLHGLLHGKNADEMRAYFEGAHGVTRKPAPTPYAGDKPPTDGPSPDVIRRPRVAAEGVAAEEAPATQELREVTDELREQMAEVKRLLQEVRTLAAKQRGAAPAPRDVQSGR